MNFLTFSKRAKLINIENFYSFIQKAKTAFIPPANGHRYTISYNLGKFSKVSIEQIVNDMKKGKIFPLVVKKGNFNTEGNIVTLGLPYIHHFNFLPFSENETKVRKITQDGFWLEALPKHIFQGSVYHRIQQTDKGIFYSVDGYGIPNESYFSYFTNTAFIKLGSWDFFIKMNVLKAVRKLEEQA